MWAKKWGYLPTKEASLKKIHGSGTKNATFGIQYTFFCKGPVHNEGYPDGCVFLFKRSLFKKIRPHNNLYTLRRF